MAFKGVEASRPYSTQPAPFASVIHITVMEEGPGVLRRQAER
jgi:hypothetical protein